MVSEIQGVRIKPVPTQTKVGKGKRKWKGP